MKPDWLKRLGQGERIDGLCAEAGVSRNEFDAWWRQQCTARLSAKDGEWSVAGLHGPAKITRDERGVPHIEAADDRDLFFALGFATAQDRLFQLDYLRRKSLGRLAEILGPDAVASDLLYRTIDLPGIAEREWRSLPSETRTLLAAYTSGINAWMSQTAGNLPIEFSVLDYAPEPWRETDSLAIIGEFRWYLTGRFPVIAIPEVVKRAVGDGPLFRDFIVGELDDESILQHGDYKASPRWEGARGGTTGGEAGGSNNWAISPGKSATGSPLVASDPHIPYYAVSIWHEVRLKGGSFHVAGVALAGMPSIMIGRSEHVAWGITNNICSLRDLYQEKTDPAHPGCFLFDGKWEPACSREVEICVRGKASVRKTVVSSRNGPIVDEVLPAPARSVQPVSLRWQGFEPCGWLTAMIAMNRAKSVAEFRIAGENWAVPTFNLVAADTAGNIAFQSVGKIPLRKIEERAYRPGWDPAHQWQGTIPYDALPHLVNPPRGYMQTANNRTVPSDFPYPVAGCWAAGYRARRIRTSLANQAQWSLDDCRLLQLDAHSGRAELCVPALSAILSNSGDAEMVKAAEGLTAWDRTMAADSKPAAFFAVFFQHWCGEVTKERLGPSDAAFASATAGGIAVRLLTGESNGWFHKRTVEQAVLDAARLAVSYLREKLGSDESKWTWGGLHRLSQRHCLSGRGDLGELLDKSGAPMPGDGVTVNAGTYDAEFQSYLGAGFRMVVDLGDPKKRMRSIEVAGVSGQPGSPHYDDQQTAWREGRLYEIALASEPRGPVVLLKPS